MLHFIVLLMVIGLLLWAFNAYIPCAEPIKRIINIVVVIGVVVMVLQFFGIFDMGPGDFRYHR